MKLFMHAPKCAGTSVRLALESLPYVKMTHDYESFARLPRHERAAVIAQSMSSPQEAGEDEIIFGHFFPVKYIGRNIDRDFKLVTILRDPFDRIVSHYKFWSRGDFSNHYVWRRMKGENWTLVDFALCEEMRNFYSQYMEGVGPQAFSYIGLYETLDVSVRKCLETLGVAVDDMPLGHHNKTGSDDEIDLDADIIDSIKAFHAEDYRIYDYARAKFGP